MNNIVIRRYEAADIPAMTGIWNDILAAGVSFPGEMPLGEGEMADLLAQQSSAMCACVDHAVVGLFIVHPNNIGRCAHVANASYAVSERFRGCGIGVRLVEESLRVAKALGFRGMQFNAVVAGNTSALRIYEKLGFEKVGTIPGGFRMVDGFYSDMYILYCPL